MESIGIWILFFAMVAVFSFGLAKKNIRIRNLQTNLASESQKLKEIWESLTKESNRLNQLRNRLTTENYGSDKSSKITEHKEITYDSVISEIEEIREVLENNESSYKQKVLKEIVAIHDYRKEGNDLLANKISDYFYFEEMKIANYLKKKQRPEYSASHEVFLIAKEKSELQKQLVLCKYKIDFYEENFPWLKEFGKITDEEYEKYQYDDEFRDEIQKKMEVKYEADLKVYKNEIVSDIKKIEEKRIESNNLVAKKLSDYFYATDMEVSQYLQHKHPPAKISAEKVSQIAKEKRKLQKELKLREYQIKFYEDTFPWLEEFNEITDEEYKEIINETIPNNNEEYETMRKWLSPQEYQSLSNVEKYQIALDRYRNRPNKSNWQIGIEYERYIGYIYETKGYKVKYQGAIEGLNDLGRDIIATKENEILVIQCKYWRQERTVREKHIFQLFGTTFSVKEENSNMDVKGILIISCDCSKRAKKFAEILGIEIKEKIPFKRDYPCIKCNINLQSHEKIYHLPFDQQYDRIDITKKKGEMYAKTVAEAEKKGFRRAKRYFVNN